MHQPSRHVKKISRARRDGMFSPLAPLDERFPLQHIRDGFLQAVMMDPRLRSGLDKNVPPHSAEWIPSSEDTAARRSEPGV
jgi:hypothetical protein